MKKLLFILAVLIPTMAIGQTTIDRAMSVWARNIVNANFTEVYGDVDDLESANGVFHQQIVVDSSEAISLTEDTWAVVTNATSAFWTASGAGVTAAGDSVTIVTAGDYFVDISLSFKATADDSLQVAVFKNAVRAIAPAEVQTIGTETVNAKTSGLLLNLVAGDDLSIRMQNTASNDNATVLNGSLVLYMLNKD